MPLTYCHVNWSLAYRIDRETYPRELEELNDYKTVPFSSSELHGIVAFVISN